MRELKYRYTDMQGKYLTISIKENSLHDCFIKYYTRVNKEKYLNTQFKLLNYQDEFKKWFTIDNYAKCGGDLW